MTAEIGILNRSGVALAADSAVTIAMNGKQKVLNSANKLFNLIKGYPVGVMVYGNGDFLGIPWDVIIDDYRKQYDRNAEYDTLNEYVIDFLEKLSNDKFCDRSSYIGKIYRDLYKIISEIVDNTKIKLSEKYPNRDITQEEARSEFKDNLQKEIDILYNKEFSTGFNEEDIKIIKEDADNSQIVKMCLEQHVFFDLTLEIIEKAKEINALIQCKEYYVNYTGLVFSGYGYNELFPSLFEFTIDGIINGKLKYKLNKHVSISAEAIGNNIIAEIVPFAQQEMVHSILNGIDPNVYQLLINNLDCFVNALAEDANNIFDCNVCKKERIQELINKAAQQLGNMMSFINEKCKECYTNPVLDMVSSLPKDELATMAETLVNLTSFKRKITIDAETVGGPIDVAVISKSEGFVWMKRKLYFSQNLNPNYNLYKGGNINEK